MSDVVHDVTVPDRGPLISPVTDFLSILTPRFQLYKDPVCAKLQVKFLNCLEAYGSVGVKKYCTEVLYDLNECATHKAQKSRVKKMLKERMKQYREGKLSTPFEEYPPLESYLSFSK